MILNNTHQRMRAGLLLSGTLALCACDGTDQGSSSSIQTSVTPPISSSSLAVASSSSTPIIASSLHASSSSIAATSSSANAANASLELQEQQAGACLGNAVFEDSNTGYTGAGYINSDNYAGAKVASWVVNATQSTQYTVEIRFANGGTDSRPSDLTVNQGGSGTHTLMLPVTGGWTTWQTETLTVDLVQGDNVFELVANDAAGSANIDYLKIIGNGLTAGTCDTPQPASSSSAANPSSSDGNSSIPAQTGFININDKTPGWASVNGGTTGGGTDLSKAVTVSNMSALKAAASGNSSKIVLVTPGTYDGALEPGANTTIIGTAPGVTISGNIKISGSTKKNIIVRNLAVRGKKCNSNDACKGGSDGVYIGSGASNIWFDHVDVADGQDGNFDVTRSGDFVTCSWCKFHYTYTKDHSLSNLIAGSDNETESRGKLNITYMYSMWGDKVNSRQPRGRFGKIHMLNNYHKNGGSLHGVGKEMALIAEGCYYDVPGKSVFFTMGGAHKGWKGIGNEGTAKGLNDSTGSVFTIPYQYSVMSASDAKAAVTSPNCGVGNTCRLQM